MRGDEHEVRVADAASERGTEAPGAPRPTGGLKKPSARPRVVVIVRGAAAGAVVAAATAPIDGGARVELRPAPRPQPPKEPAAEPATTTPQPPVTRPTPKPREDHERPTEKIKKLPPRARTPEDEQVVAAMISLDLAASPGPLADFLGRSLLFRAAHAAARAGAQRLILLGKVPEELQRRVYDEAYAGFGGRPVEVRGEDPLGKDFGRGRVLILDGCALHDADALRRLASAKGDAAALLLSRHGDGLRARTEKGKIREVGIELPQADGLLAGAASVPVELFERFTRTGERAALDEMGAIDLLSAVVDRHTFAQQLHTQATYDTAAVASFDQVASSGTGAGVFDDTIGRPISRAITAFMLHRPFFTPTRVSVLAGILALVGAFLLGLGGFLPLGIVARLSAVLAGLALIASAVLDRTDGELARLRLDEDEDARFLDFGLDHLTHMIVFLALAVTVQQRDSMSLLAPHLPAQLRALLDQYEVQPIHLGYVALLGVVVLMCVLLWRGAPRREATGLRRFGDALANIFNSRDYFYLLLVAAALDCIPLLNANGFMAGFLLGTAVLVHLFWLVLFLVSLASPRPSDDAG